MFVQWFENMGVQCKHGIMASTSNPYKMRNKTGKFSYAFLLCGSVCSFLLGYVGTLAPAGASDGFLCFP